MKTFRIACAAAALVLPLAGAAGAVPLVCQPTGDGVTGGDALSEANQTSELDFTFCQGDPGVPFCFVGDQGTLLDLNLSGRANVDITCQFNIPNSGVGRICIADGNCEESSFVTRPGGDDEMIRLAGDLLPSTSYKIAVFEIVAGGNAICPGPGDGGNIESVTCSGNWGTEPSCFTLTRQHTPGQGGSDPTASPARSAACTSNGQYVSGESIQLTASPSSGWTVSGWTGTANDSSTSNSNSLTMPGANHTVSVTYAPPACFTLTTGHSPAEGGSDPTTNPARSDGCSSNGQFVAGENVRLRARPATGWDVSGWTGTSNDSSTSINNTVTMPGADHSVSASYVQECYVLRTTHTPRSGGNDPTAEPASSDACSNGEYVAGEQLEVTAAPAAGWEMERWKGTDNDASSSTTNTVTMPAGRHDVLAVYTRPIVDFDSSFETKGFCDWSSRDCNGCEEFSCDLATGDVSVPINSYRTLEAGEHRGTLRGPEDADFDLALEWWTGSDWVPVASNVSPSSSEEVVYEGDPGFYRWQIKAEDGAGEYGLKIAYPGLKMGDPNHLEQAKKPKKDGKRSLKAIFDKTSKHFDYLADFSPGSGGSETSYEASFYLQPDNKLLVKGKRHQIFQLRQVQGVSKARPIVELFLQGKNGRYSVAARVLTNNAGKPKSPPVPFDGGKWTPIRIVWNAASGSGQSDGLIQLWVDGQLGWSMDLDNSSQAVDRAFLGQVTKGSKKTNGDLYFDDFRSSWGD